MAFRVDGHESERPLLKLLRVTRAELSNFLEQCYVGALQPALSAPMVLSVATFSGHMEVLPHFFGSLFCVRFPKRFSSYGCVELLEVLCVQASYSVPRRLVRRVLPNQLAVNPALCQASLEILPRRLGGSCLTNLR